MVTKGGKRVPVKLAASIQQSLEGMAAHAPLHWRRPFAICGPKTAQGPARP
jgi:hypothetical protein